MTLVTDPKDPRLTRYAGPEEPAPQAEVYLVLSEGERSKGWVRPLRSTYRHVGAPGPKHPLRDLTADEEKRYGGIRYVKFEEYLREPISSVTGRFWTQEQLDKVGKGCGTETTMGAALSETYALDPKFYGATYCCGCSAHFPVGAFRWTKDNEVVGS